MEMRPRYRGRVDSDELFHLSPRKDAVPSLEEQSGITLIPNIPPQIQEFVHQREIRDVVEEVRDELLHSPSPTSQQRFELTSKEDLMDTDTTALWSTSLFDGTEESTARVSILDDSTAPTKDGYEPRPRKGRNRVRNRDKDDDIIIRRRKYDDTIDSRTVETTVMSFDDQSEFSTSCSFFTHEWRDQGIFCCGTEIGEDVNLVADQSNSIVETTATGLLHHSILESADDFFSEEQAQSLQKTLSEVSEEFDEAGNKVIDLTAMMNMRNLCAKQDAVDLEQVKSESETIPSEVSFRVRVLDKLSSNKKSSTWRKKHLRQPSKQAEQHKKGRMFRKFKKHFRKGSSSKTAAQ